MNYYTERKIAEAENELQRHRKAIAEACSKDTPLDRKLFLAKNHRGQYDDIRVEMARCPHMEIEVLRELYKNDDLKYLVSTNPQTPSHMMDSYIDNGTELEQMGCFGYLAQSKQLSDDQWTRLSKSDHVNVRRKLAKQASWLPEQARENLLNDEDGITRKVAENSVEKARKLAAKENSF